MDNKNRSTATLGAGFVILSSLFYAAYGVWVVLIGNFLGDFLLSTLRSLLVVLLLLPVALLQKQLGKIYWRRDAWLLVGQVISAIFISAPFFYAVKIIGVGLGAAVMYAGIIIGAFFFAALLAGERYTKDKWLATLFGIVGLWLVFTPNLQTFGILAFIAALISGLAAGCTMVLNKKLPYNSSQTMLITWTATIIANIPLLFLFNEQFPSLSGDIHWLYLLLFAITSLASSWLLIGGLKRIEAGIAGILGLLEIVFGVLFGILFFGEQPTLVTRMGMICIIFAAALPYLKELYKKNNNI